jgi:heme-degrading monooxygenase HmoA
MYIKWIVCQVKEGMKDAFSHAQEQWISTAEAEGFLAQVGGWNINDENEACIIAFWESQQHLVQFMANLHDQIFEENRQSATYHTISVSYFKSLLEMDGQADSLKEAVKNSSLLRIADCDVWPESIKHFEAVQRSVWLPGMQQSEGMLGGLFSNASKQPHRYLVSTFWDSAEHHDRFAREKLPVLRDKAAVEQDLNRIFGRQIGLVESWKVIP